MKRLAELEKVSLMSDLTAKGDRDALAQMDLNLLRPGIKYFAFYVPVEEK